jgi:hypothetical protein
MRVVGERSEYDGAGLGALGGECAVYVEPLIIARPESRVADLDHCARLDHERAAHRHRNTANNDAWAIVCCKDRMCRERAVVGNTIKRVVSKCIFVMFDSPAGFEHDRKICAGKRGACHREVGIAYRYRVVGPAPVDEVRRDDRGSPMIECDAVASGQEHERRRTDRRNPVVLGNRSAAASESNIVERECPIAQQNARTTIVEDCVTHINDATLEAD